jgi:hypothetical protein
MKIQVPICDLCEGEYKLAVASYVDAIGEEHDICKDCETIVRKEGLLCRSLTVDEEVTELFRVWKARWDGDPDSEP